MSRRTPSLLGPLPKNVQRTFVDRILSQASVELVVSLLQTTYADRLQATFRGHDKLAIHRLMCELQRSLPGADESSHDFWALTNAFRSKEHDIVESVVQKQEAYGRAIGFIIGAAIGRMGIKVTIEPATETGGDR